MVFAEVLGVGVNEALVRRWRTWFAPSVQPFRTDLLPPEVAAAVPAREAKPTPEWEDTFFMYSGTWTWLSEQEFNSLCPTLRRSLLTVRRRTVRPKSMPAWASELASSHVQMDCVGNGPTQPASRCSRLGVETRASGAAGRRETGRHVLYRRFRTQLFRHGPRGHRTRCQRRPGSPRYVSGLAGRAR